MDDWGAFATVGKKKKGKKDLDPPLEPAAPDPLVPAAADPEDEWGFSTGKKKKGKKGKVSSTISSVPITDGRPGIRRIAGARPDFGLHESLHSRLRKNTATTLSRCENRI